MNWISTLIKVCGSISPFTAPLVQFQSELDAAALQNRLMRLEDPLSALHPEIPEVSSLIYSAIKKANDVSFAFDDETYRKFRRSLAVLESEEHIACAHRLGRDVPLRIVVSDPAYLIFYLCARLEAADKMETLVQTVDACPPGHWLDGHAIAQQLELPVPVAKACFNLYEAKGFGVCSREIGRVSYCGRV